MFQFVAVTNISPSGPVTPPERSTQQEDVMKRIGLGIVALGLSLSALTLGTKAANAAEPCAPAPVLRAGVQPAGYYYVTPRDRELRARHLRIERERELARRRWMNEHRFYRY
jgi:hypothetical protein